MRRSLQTAFPALLLLLMLMPSAPEAAEQTIRLKGNPLRPAGTAPLDGLPAGDAEVCGAGTKLLVQLAPGIDAGRLFGPRYGRMVLAHIPDNAFVVRADGLIGSDVDRFSFAGPLPSAHRLSPAFEREACGGHRDVYIRLFRDADPACMAERLADRHGAIVHRIDRHGLLVSLACAGLERELDRLSRSDATEMIVPWREPVLLNDASSWLLQGGTDSNRLRVFWAAGITGRGQVYGACDSGLDTDACHFRYTPDPSGQTLSNPIQPPEAFITNPDGKVLSYYLLRGAQAYDNRSGQFHGTMTTGCAVGDSFVSLFDGQTFGYDKHDGMAPAARVVFQDVGDHLGNLPGLFYVSQSAIHQQAYDSGVRVHNNSWGQEYSVEYDYDSEQIDHFIWSHDEYLVFFASGNSGPGAGTLGGEGSTAKNTVVVGATVNGRQDDANHLAGFSSRGPTADSRLKPDLVAPGIVTSAVESGGVEHPGQYDRDGRMVVESATDPGNNNCATASTGGTSFSSPTAAGMALLVRQYFADGFHPGGRADPAAGFEPSAALVKAVLVNGAENLTGKVVGFGSGGMTALGDVDPRPSQAQGWGRINLDRALHLAGQRRDGRVVADVRNGAAGALETGSTASYQLYVRAGEQLRLTLAWSDPPGSLGAELALVNDLDLELVDPAGARYHGNVNFVGGFSRPDPDGLKDSLNNLEAIFVAEPAEGWHEVRVIAAGVPGNGMLDPFPSNRQGYALFASGDFTEGPEIAQANLGLSGTAVTDGCDNDDFIERNETVFVEATVHNVGDVASAPLALTLSVCADSEVMESDLTISQPTVNLPSVRPYTTGKAAFRVRLADLPESLCGMSVRFCLTAGPAADPLLEAAFAIPVDVDRLADGRLQCEYAPCDPSPLVESFEPDRIAQGGRLAAAIVRGRYFAYGDTVVFSNPGLAYDHSAVEEGGTAIRLIGLSAVAGAEIGPVTVSVVRQGGRSGSAAGLLAVVAGSDPTDGDDDGDDGVTDGDDGPDGDTNDGVGESDGETAADGDAAGAEDGGCTGGGAPLFWLGLWLAGLAAVRRGKG